ncbi:CGNR zinc finger domain-containing protein [Paenibacillus sp.]|uniref:CGNR zinc finger domain-containing protein n=1 Tax=Paenibacillus sp. TaxID=58172 RepID=UPI0028123AFB|nr:CGNR zinc finger domain-containing protein [Paenibacillus sp.]
MPKKIAPTFYFIGNHPVIDFVNTVIPIDGKLVDLLGSLAELLDWMVIAGFLRKDEAADYVRKWEGGSEETEVLETARTLRNGLAELLGADKAGHDGSDGIETVNRLLKERIVTTRLLRRSDGGFIAERRTLMRTPLELLVPIAEAAVDFFSRCDSGLVKKCENPDCVLRFYDQSRNATRRWCSQKTCGNRMKVAAFMERRRQQRE